MGSNRGNNDNAYFKEILTTPRVDENYHRNVNGSNANKTGNFVPGALNSNVN